LNNKQIFTNETEGKSNTNINPILSIRKIDEIWERASSENVSNNDRMVVHCTKVITVNHQSKAVVFPVMFNKSGQVYWCYKSEIFGFHNRCVSDMMNLPSSVLFPNIFHGYGEVFRRGQGESIEVPARMKTSTTDPEKVGNKILFYVVNLDDDSEYSVDDMLKCFVDDLAAMQAHPEYLQICLDKTFERYGGKYNDNMKKMLTTDRTFLRS